MPLGLPGLCPYLGEGLLQLGGGSETSLRGPQAAADVEVMVSYSQVKGALGLTLRGLQLSEKSSHEISSVSEEHSGRGRLRLQALPPRAPDS